MFAPFTMLDQGQYGLDFYWPEDPDHALPLDPDGQLHFKVTTRGPWSLPDSFRALAIEAHTVPRPYGLHPISKGVTVWGFRSLQGAREDGYDYRGRVKAGGRRMRAFTSDKMVTYQGRLTTLAVLYAYEKKGEG
jgi:hypothetical protein